VAAGLLVTLKNGALLPATLVFGAIAATATALFQIDRDRN
jgi:hypothetical protein